MLKSSAGAAEHLAVCRVTNLSRTVDQLKEKGLWIFACEADGSPYDKVDYKGPIAIILGSEGFGVSRLLKELLISSIKEINLFFCCLLYSIV